MMLEVVVGLVRKEVMELDQYQEMEVMASSSIPTIGVVGGVVALGLIPAMLAVVDMVVEVEVGMVDMVAL